MRPPQKAGGNTTIDLADFNEAPAKSGGEWELRSQGGGFNAAKSGAESTDAASMRPPQKAGGNPARMPPAKRRE